MVRRMVDATPSPNTPTPVAFSYALTGTGWSAAELTVGQTVRDVSASYLSDALGDLLGALVQLTEADGEARVSWEEEPGEFRWILTRTGDDLAIRLLWFDDLYPPQPDEQGLVGIDDTCAFTAFVQAVAGAARAVLGEHGEDGYLERWVEHPFPTAHLHALEQWLAR